MATLSDWLEGARPRTLPAAAAPVLAGSATALAERQFVAGMALLAGVVALALQVGVNYANDYSDGIRGTDEVRVGPMRLVGSGAARPGQVKAAAFASFGVAAVAGLALVVWSGYWWLLAVGVACIVAAWFYTGGDHPYGYAGLGEVFVFIFFGLVAVCGTTYVMLGRITWATLLAAIGIGALACALLVANNLRDVHTDVHVGKRTLATRLGDSGTRRSYVVLVAVATLTVLGVAALTTWWALLGLAMIPLLITCVRAVLGGASGLALIRVLKLTGLAELVCGVGLFVGVLIGT